MAERPPNHRTPWTEAEYERAAELLRADHTLVEIATLLGRTYATTCVMLNQRGLTRGSTHCLHCGTAIDSGSPVGRKRRYCNSVNCRREVANAAKDRRRGFIFDPEKSCAYCANPISLERQRHWARYCCPTCNKDAWYAEKCAREGRVPVKNPAVDRTDVLPCRVCTKPIPIERQARKAAIYCSKECGYVGQLERARHGSPATGYPGHLPKLNPDSVRLLRALRTQGLTQRAIAEQLGVSRSVVRRVLVGEAWKNVS